MPKILKCSILGCHENSRNVMEEISFHRIPKDEATRKQWIDLIRSKTNQPNVFSIHALVCSKHFKTNQFAERGNGSRVLINYAIPSIFPNETHMESYKADWSEDEDLTNTIKNATLPPPTIAVQPCNRSETKIISKTTDDLVGLFGIAAKVSPKHEDGKKQRSSGRSEFNKSCRFCLCIPVATEVENPLLSENIASMYKSLTGIEFYTTTYSTPETICTTCSTKLKNAFEFREHLIKMDSHWEKTLFKVDDVDDADDDAMVTEFEPISEPKDVEPKLEVIIVEADNENSENLETIEYVDYEAEEDDFDDDDDENRGVESDEDDKFIQDVEDFVKTVKPVPRSQLRRIEAPKQIGRLLTTKKARNIAADTERLNFRSTSSPHSSQKLKKDNKWWRLMHDCNYCDAGDFLTVEAINKHLKLEHADLVKVTCDICKKDYSELKYLKKHMKYVHQTRQNECPICKKKFYYNYNLKSHMQSHTNEKTSICHLCGKFFTQPGLHAHLKTGIHGPIDRSAKDQIAKSTRYYCHICVPAKRFNMCAELTEHRRLLHNDFECPICKGWFSCAESLQNHLKTHSNKERKHCCTLCPSTYVRASHLVGHMRRKHSADPKPISCDLCDYKCVEQYELYGHKKHAHSTSRPYKCILCTKSFSKDQAHKDHMLTSHGIGQYRYSCSECPKRFTNSAGLIHHRGIHHKGKGNKNS